MAPHSASPEDHAVPVGRRSRKRQSRRTGRARKGCTAVCNRLAECQLGALIRKEEVNARVPEDIQSVLSIITSTAELAINDSEILQLPGGSVLAVQDASNANVAFEAPDCGASLYSATTEIVHPMTPSLEASVHSSILESVAILQCEDKAPFSEEALAPAGNSVDPKRVRFNFDATSLHEVTPYAEIYGAHPRTFVFDKDSQMIPAARGGFVSADCIINVGDDEDDEEGDSSDDDGGWETWLLEQETISDDSHEAERSISFGLVCETCLPDLDDEAGWETWLESTLGHTQDDFYDDSIPCA